jgi:hypothetical protein
MEKDNASADARRSADHTAATRTVSFGNVDPRAKKNRLSEPGSGEMSRELSSLDVCTPFEAAYRQFVDTMLQSVN